MEKERNRVGLKAQTYSTTYAHIIQINHYNMRKAKTWTQGGVRFLLVINTINEKESKRKLQLTYIWPLYESVWWRIVNMWMREWREVDVVLFIFGVCRGRRRAVVGLRDKSCSTLQLLCWDWSHFPQSTTCRLSTALFICNSAEISLVGTRLLKCIYSQSHFQFIYTCFNVTVIQTHKWKMSINLVGLRYFDVPLISAKLD